MSDNEILNAVKTMLFGTTAGNFRDSLISLYINEVKDFMLNAGVSPNALKSEKSVGVIALGVNDLWNYQAGGVKLSEYFTQRVIQLAADPDQSYFDDKTLKTYLWYTKTTAPQTTNVLFYIPQYDPTKGGTISVFVNGMLCTENVDYTLNDYLITFVIPKIENTEIVVSYSQLEDKDSSAAEYNYKKIVAFSWYTKTTAPQTTNVLFDIPQYDPSSSDKIHVFVNGMLCVENVDYTQNDDEIIFSIPKVANTEIIVFVNKFVNSEI